MLIIFVFLNTNWVETTIKGIKCIKLDVLTTCDSNPTQTGLSIRRNVYGLIYVKIPNTELVSAGTAWYRSSNYAIIFLPLPPLLIFAFSILACSSVKYSPSDIKTSVHSFIHLSIQENLVRLDIKGYKISKRKEWRNHFEEQISRGDDIVEVCHIKAELSFLWFQMANWREVTERLKTGSWTCVSNFTITRWKACLWMGSTQRTREQRWRKKSPREVIWAAESSHIKNQIYLRFFTNMRFYLPSLCLNNAFGLVGLSFVLVNKRILKSTRTIRIPVPQTFPGTQ